MTKVRIPQVSIYIDKPHSNIWHKAFAVSPVTGWSRFPGGKYTCRSLFTPFFWAMLEIVIA